MAARRGRRKHGKKRSYGKTAAGSSKMLRVISKKLTRIEKKINPERFERLRSRRHRRHEESALASKYS